MVILVLDMKKYLGVLKDEVIFLGGSMICGVVVLEKNGFCYVVMDVV